jgi:hypothetical protein
MAEKPLIIQAPSQGIAQSPHVGFGDVRNIDLYSTPGVAKLNFILAKKSASTVDARIKWMVKNPASPANIYAVDSNGSVYNSSDSGATWAELSDRGGSGQGLIIWKDYLFVCEDTTIDVYGPLSGSPSWSDNWQTIDSDTAWHPLFVSKNDGNIYGGAGRYVFSIAENSGQNFAPGTGATFTFTQQALDLPEDHKVKCLEELGNNLMIGTWQGTNIYDSKVADIFPWDRSSSSFNKPVSFNNNGINAMLNINNSLFVLAGIDGGIYRTDGYNVYKIGQIPNYTCDIVGGNYIEPYPGSLINHKERPYFGVSGNAAIGGCGIYSLLETSGGNILTMEHTISTGNSGATNICEVSALLGVTRENILAGWRDNTTYGIDSGGTTNYTTTYGAYFESPLYRVGTFIDKRQFRKIQIQLTKELLANEGIKLEFRINLTDAFTTIGTYTTTEFGAGVTSYAIDPPIPACEFLQFKVSLTGTTTTPSFKNLIVE